MNLHITDLSKACQALEEKALTIHQLSGLTLDDIIDRLAKGFEFVPPKPSYISLEDLAKENNQ